MKMSKIKRNVINPDKNEYRGYDGYLQVESILRSFYEEKYGINSKKKDD